MTSKEFCMWLRGFTEGVHDFNITPKQWDILKERLDEVEDEEDFVETPGMFEVHREPPYSPYPPYYDPYNPFKVTCNLTGSGTTITTTPGYGSITIANPNIASFGTVTTSTATSLPSGSTISYTTSNDKTLLND